MTGKKIPNQNTPVQRARALKATMVKVGKNLAEASELVRGIQSGDDPDVVDALLAVEAGVTRDDARLLRAIGAMVEKDSEILTTGISPETLRLLSQASGAEVQDAAIRTIKAGIPVGEEKMRRLETHRSRAEEGDDQVAANARWARLQSFAAMNAEVMLRRLESKADGLRAAAQKFVFHFAPPHPQEGFEMESDRPGYFEAHANVAVLASDVLADFKQILGPREAFETGDLKDSEALLLKQAFDALTRFAAGHFGHQGGFAFEAAEEDVFSSDIIDALAYISTQSLPDVPRSAPYTRPPHTLHVLELGAGAGGQAIGLMSAGFRHAALYEKVSLRADTLKANWDWPVVQTDLKKVKDSALARYRGIDLLAGGIPSAAFSRRSGESKRGSDDDLLPDLLRAVRAISPRGFMFEGTRGITFEPNLPYLAEFNAQLAAVGYTVDVVRLNSADFGLPVDDERIVIVGIRNDEAGAFIPPVLQNPTRKFVSEALGDLVIRYETAPALQDTVVRNTPQWDYDRWAKRWRKRFEGKLLSTIPRESTEIREVRLNAGKDAGFDRSRFSDEATRVEEFPNVDDDYFLPKLTVAVLARAQGFPDKWSFHAERGGNIDMIADALPPVVAKAVGLQIYSALTGISFDLDAAIAEPIINESMIGRKLRLNAGRVRWDVLQKAEMLVRGEAAILEPGAKKRKVMQQALIKDVEPNHMKRTHLREVAEGIRWERERQQMEDDAWEERLFPNGVPEGAAD